MQTATLSEENLAQEDAARTMLDSYMERIHQSNKEKNINELLSPDTCAERFLWFLPFIDLAAKNRILVSGCAIGSELLVAERYGFLNIIGTEVDPALMEIARLRLRSKEHMRIDAYDGLHLPYADEHFSMICSAHIIEHTSAPELYFQEHMRVLKPGGYFYLEFPNRYHHTELHTGLPSVEWLPHRLRRSVLRLLSSRFSPFSVYTKQYYNLILLTLQPIGIPQIRRFLKRSRSPDSAIVALQIPLPGFVRLLIRKA